jgi:hypothetical protein
MALASTRAIWRYIGVVVSIAAAAAATAAVALATNGPIRVDVYLGEKRVGQVTGGEILWTLGGNECDIRVDGSSGVLEASDGIGPITNTMRPVSATRWDYYVLGRGVRRLGYAVRVSDRTWNVFSSPSRGVARKLGHVQITLNSGAGLVAEAGPAGAFGLLMLWPHELHCLQ